MIETATELHNTIDTNITRRTLGSLVMSGYALAAVGADAAPVMTDDHGLIIEETQITNGAPHPLPAYVARPKHGKMQHPTIIVVNEIFGIHAYIKDVCRRLAHLGYVAIAPDFFYRSGVNLAQISDFKQIMPIVAQASDDQVDGDVRAVTQWLKAQPFVNPHKIGITGFCWGGAVTWRTCMVNPDIKAGVAWYGRLEKLIPRAAEVKTPVLGLYGALDKGIPQTEVAAMRAGLAKAHAKAEIIVYPDAEHGFHADYRPSYNERDAKDGWQRLLAHFKAHGVG